MLDIDTRDLLAVAEDALTAPTHLPPALLAEWHSHTLNNRLPLIREALRIAREEGDAERATRLVDQAVHDYPTSTGHPVPGVTPHM